MLLTFFLTHGPKLHYVKLPNIPKVEVIEI